MNVSRRKILCVEIYKTINKINPQFMNEVFNLKENKGAGPRKIKTESRSSQVEPGHICEKKSQNFWFKNMEQPTISHQVISKSRNF